MRLIHLSDIHFGGENRAAVAAAAAYIDERANDKQTEALGAIFTGRWSPVALGDYTAGTNHILPTAGGSRFFSPLGVRDFLKFSHVVSLSSATFREIRGAAELLAMREGLPLHAASIAAREAS